MTARSRRRRLAARACRCPQHSERSETRGAPRPAARAAGAAARRWTMTARFKRPACRPPSSCTVDCPAQRPCRRVEPRDLGGRCNAAYLHRADPARSSRLATSPSPSSIATRDDRRPSESGAPYWRVASPHGDSCHERRPIDYRQAAALPRCNLAHAAFLPDRLAASSVDERHIHALPSRARRRERCYSATTSRTFWIGNYSAAIHTGDELTQTRPASGSPAMNIAQTCETRTLRRSLISRSSDENPAAKYRSLPPS